MGVVKTIYKMAGGMRDEVTALEHSTLKVRVNFHPWPNIIINCYCSVFVNNTGSLWVAEQEVQNYSKIGWQRGLSCEFITVWSHNMYW